MKTAMQELIEWVDNDFRKQSTIPTIQQLKNKAKQLLEKEKDAIIIAWNDSKISIMNGEQYFEETYNQKNL